MSDLKRLIEAIDDVDEIYSYIKGDYFDEKWGLGEKAERVKGLLLAYRDLLANGRVVDNTVMAWPGEEGLGAGRYLVVEIDPTEEER